jgi:hypothetical protein
VGELGIGVFDKGGTGRIPPSAAIRVHRRVRNVSHHVGDVLDAERIAAGAYAAGEGPRRDVLVVVRDAVEAPDAEWFLARAERDGARLVVDLDDDLVTPSARERLVRQGYDGQRLDALVEVISRADQVLVSTAPLATLVQPLTKHPVEVVPNELDPLLWTVDIPAEPDASDPTVTRLLYFGSRTHAGDLALVEGLPGALSERLGRAVVVETVGVVEKGTALPDGFVAVDPPRPHYAGFVRWLRGQGSRWRAGLAPLADEPFNAMKSDLKLLEYAGLGLPAVASPVGPYRDAPPALARHAQGVDSWVEQVATCLAEPAAVSAARETLVKDRTMSRETLQRWVRLVSGQPWSRLSR